MAWIHSSGRSNISPGPVTHVSVPDIGKGEGTHARVHAYANASTRTHRLHAGFMCKNDRDIVNVYMYVHMYLCTYVCTYVCTSVCLSVSLTACLILSACHFMHTVVMQRNVCVYVCMLCRYARVNERMKELIDVESSLAVLATGVIHAGGRLKRGQSPISELEREVQGSVDDLTEILGANEPTN